MGSHYDRLGVPRDATREEIWRAYLSGVRAALSGERAENELARLDDAWETLRDPAARADYDRTLEADPAPFPTEPSEPPAGSPSPEPQPGPDDLLREAGLVDGPAPTRPPDPAAHESPPPAEPGPAAAPQPSAPIESGPQQGRSKRTSPPPAERPRQMQPAPSSAPPSQPVDRPGATVLAAWALVSVLIGVGAGLAVYATVGEPTSTAYEEGDCVSLSAAEATAAPCDDEAADAVVTSVVDVATDCADADAGWLERPDGAFACLELLEDG